MTATDGQFDQSLEDVENTTINTSGWTTGWHTLSVRGRDANLTWGPASTTVINITNPLLRLTGTPTAIDGDDPGDTPGGVQFSLTNTHDDEVTITSLTIDPANSSINELDDKVGRGNNDPQEVEIYAASPNNPDSYSDWATSEVFADYEALAIDDDVTVDVGEGGDNRNSGTLPRVDSGNDITFYLFEFYASDDPTDYETNENLNMSGETVTITVEYTVNGNSKTATIPITAA
ncbi:hypothetical protein D3D02_11725 [Halobellus sp. Atlit-38R]|nr:hypothetical protein D3D02_11725 [Halobellus sp. Atlit-38R]